MKKLFTLSALICFSLFLNAQPNEVPHEWVEDDVVGDAVKETESVLPACSWQLDTLYNVSNPSETIYINVPEEIAVPNYGNGWGTLDEKVETEASMKPGHEFETFPEDFMHQIILDESEKDFDVEPGSFSKNGAKYYFSIGTDENASKLAFLNRLDYQTGGEFDAKQTFDVWDKDGNILTDLNQPTLTEDELTMVFVKSTGSWQSNELWIAQRSSLEADWKDAKPLKKINTKDQPDSYPWLSPDGLILTVTQNKGGGDKVYKYQRSSLSETFSGEGAMLDLDGQSGILSAWFTSDFSEVYFACNGKIHQAKMDGNSTEKTVVHFDSEGFLSAWSMDPKGNNAVVYNATKCHWLRKLAIPFRDRELDPSEDLVFEDQIIDAPCIEHGIAPSCGGGNSGAGCQPEVNIVEGVLIEEVDKTVANTPIIVKVPPAVVSRPIHVVKPVVKDEPTPRISLGEATEKDVFLTEAYPNPSSGRVNILFKLPVTHEAADLKVFNLNGQFERSFSIEQNRGGMSLDLSDLASGTYLMFIELENGQVSGRKKLNIVR